ncbi:hypothetical protein PUN28_007385 [Cardiocondyla obscurior]|uniref:Uncharacterized protein n=1 Tax=Cardiocondyla obscurior TaxID=286306 RepID=A0AAW2G7X7_9HYME
MRNENIFELIYIIFGTCSNKRTQGRSSARGTFRIAYRLIHLDARIKINALHRGKYVGTRSRTTWKTRGSNQSYEYLVRLSSDNVSDSESDNDRDCDCDYIKKKQSSSPDLHGAGLFIPPRCLSYFLFAAKCYISRCISNSNVCSRSHPSASLYDVLFLTIRLRVSCCELSGIKKNLSRNQLIYNTSKLK